jgi:hypothetical protein
MSTPWKTVLRPAAFPEAAALHVSSWVLVHTYRHSLSGSWPAQNQAYTRRRHCPLGPPCRCDCSHDPYSCSSGPLQNSSIQRVTRLRSESWAPGKLQGVGHRCAFLGLHQPHNLKECVIKIKLGQLIETQKISYNTQEIWCLNCPKEVRVFSINWSSLLAVRSEPVGPRNKDLEFLCLPYLYSFTDQECKEKRRIPLSKFANRKVKTPNFFPFPWKHFSKKCQPSSPTPPNPHFPGGDTFWHHHVDTCRDFFYVTTLR